jgi:tetratricopeptide (TPR) repeat protein
MIIWVWLASLGLGGAPSGTPVGNDDPAAAANLRAAVEIQHALRAEAEGRDLDRREHLQSALKAAPDHPLAHGLLGTVAIDGAWVSIAEAIDRARGDDRAWWRGSEYREKRRKTADLPEAQLALARWCATSGLRAEAQAHFTRAARLDPENEEAWLRLGRRRHDGRWLTGEEIAAEAEEAAEQSRADDLWSPRLSALRTDLRLGRLGPEARKSLTSIVDPRAVPSIERVFGSEKSFDQAWRLWLLSCIDAPESSRAIAAVLVKTRDAMVRAAAVRVLAARDPRAYLGFLINQMREPTHYISQQAREGENGVLLVDTPEATVVREYDPTTVRRMTISPILGSRSAGSWALWSPAEHRMANDARAIDIQNRQVILDNVRIARSLRELTGQPFQFDRDQWAAWWSDQLGYRPPQVESHPKPLAYESVALPVMPQPKEPGPAPAGSTPLRRSCFASGTLVVARTGLAPIEDLEIGDQVLSQDTKTGAMSFQPILSVEHDPPDATLRIAFDDLEVVCTDIHRFWKVGAGWVTARDLRRGDAIRAVGRVLKARAITLNPIQPVHNIEVARNQTFFVGLAGLLVHDSTLAAPTGEIFDAKTRPPDGVVPLHKR